MREVLKRGSLSSANIIAFLTLPILITGILIYDTSYNFFKIIVSGYTSFLLRVPSWSIPIVAPLSLLLIFLGLPMIVERLSNPKYGKILFGSMSLTYAILLLNLMRVLR